MSVHAPDACLQSNTRGKPFVGWSSQQTGRHAYPTERLLSNLQLIKITGLSRLRHSSSGETLPVERTDTREKKIDILSEIREVKGNTLWAVLSQIRAYKTACWRFKSQDTHTHRERQENFKKLLLLVNLRKEKTRQQTHLFVEGMNSGVDVSRDVVYAWKQK